MSHLASILTIALLLPSVARTQERTEEPLPKPAEVVATFRDGTVICKATLKENLEITTRYGKLSVPPADIRRVEFRTYLPPEMGRKIATLIEQLGSEVFAQREAASKELIALGGLAYPFLEQAAQSPDKETARRAQEAVEQLRQSLPDEQLRFRPHDVIYTRDCVLTGQVVASVLKAHTANFGDMEFKLGDLRSFHLARSQHELTVDALAAGKWVETGVTLDAGAGLIIAASGQITLNPQLLGDQGASGPEGNPNLGPSPEGYPYGALLGRIGASGPIFPIGQRSEIKVPADGKLHLMFISPAGGSRPTGSYKVSVLTGLDVPVKEAPPVARPSTRGSFGRPDPRQGGFAPPGGMGPGAAFDRGGFGGRNRRDRDPR